MRAHISIDKVSAFALLFWGAILLLMVLDLILIVERAKVVGAAEAQCDHPASVVSRQAA